MFTFPELVLAFSLLLIVIAMIVLFSEVPAVYRKAKRRVGFVLLAIAGVLTIFMPVISYFLGS